MANILKSVLAKRMIFTRINVPIKINTYIFACIRIGSESYLYCNPYITTTFYIEGMAAANALKTAISKYNLNPTKKNLKIIKSKIVKVKIWLNSYADKVEVIANDDANRDTPAEASINIAHSFLTSRKLLKNRKGKAPKPKLSWKRSKGDGIIVEIINGKTYNPMQTHFILVESSMNATGTIADGEVIIEQKQMGQIIFKSANAKGRFTHFKRIRSGVKFDIYAYSQNGNNNCSELSNKLTLNT